MPKCKLKIIDRAELKRMSNWSLNPPLYRKEGTGSWDLCLNIFVHLKTHTNKNRTKTLTSYTLNSNYTPILTKKSPQTLHFYIHVYEFALITPHVGKHQQKKYAFTLPFITLLHWKINGVKQVNLISSFPSFLGSKGKFLTIPSAWIKKKKKKKKGNKINSQMKFIVLTFFNVT